ncbi:MAG: hypothetical protein ACM3P1_13840 [Candidatus Saccharibacteria bacterium]
MTKLVPMLMLTVFTFLLTLPDRATGQIRKIVAFDKAGFDRKTINKSGKDYESIMFKESFHSREEGKPDLPFFIIGFIFPRDRR